MGTRGTEQRAKEATGRRRLAEDGVGCEVAALIRAVGTRVRAARAVRGLSRRALAELSGVSPRYLAQLEAGEGNISIGLLKRVADALGTPVDGLMRDDDPLAEELAHLAARFREADAAVRARVIGVLDPDRLRAQKARRLCLIGLRGAGKSTLGGALGRAFDAPFVELNREIEAGAGMPVGEVIALYGEEGYRRLEAEVVNDIVASHQRVVLAVAGGVVSEAATFEVLLSRFHTVWLKAAPGDHMERVRAQGDLRPMAGNPQALVRLREILKAREARYRMAEHHLDTSGRSVDESIADLRALVAERRILTPEDGRGGLTDGRAG